MADEFAFDSYKSYGNIIGRLDSPRSFFFFLWLALVLECQDVEYSIWCVSLFLAEVIRLTLTNLYGTQHRGFEAIPVPRRAG